MIKMTIVTPTKNFTVHVENRTMALQVIANSHNNNGILMETLWVPQGMVEGIQFEEVPVVQQAPLELIAPTEKDKPKKETKK